MSSSVRPSSASRPADLHLAPPRDVPASFITMVMLMAILLAGTLVLGSARLWYELPLLGGIAVLFLFQAIRLARPAFGPDTRRIDAIDISVLLFVVYAIGRWLTSPTEYFSRLEILNVIAYAGIFFTCRYGLVRRMHGLLLLGLLILLGIGEAGFGYYLHNHPDWCPFGDAERLHQYYAPRWVGTYGCPNHYSSLLAMATAATLGVACFSRFSWPFRIVLFYAAALMMVGIAFSGSRGGWIALFMVFVALVIFGLRHGTLRWWVPVTSGILVTAVVISLFALSPFVQGRYHNLVDMFDKGELHDYVRVQLTEDALTIAHDYPIFGTGPATFIFIHPRYQSSTYSTKAELTHDDYLNCLDDYGLVGFAIAIFFVIAVTLQYFRQVRATHRWQDRVLFASGFAAWAALAIHSFVDFNMHIPANALWIFALTGLGLRRTPDDIPEKHWSQVSLAPLDRWLGVALLLFLIPYGAEVARTAVSDIDYEEAVTISQGVSKPESIEKTKEALKIDPGNAQALVFLGDLYRYRASREKTFESRVSEGQLALTAYQRALVANPLDDTVHGRLGLTFDLMRRYPEAFFSYQQAVTAQPYDGQFWKALGNHFWERGLLIKAEEAYLIAAACPHGNEGSQAAADELGKLLDAEGIARPAPGSNPLAAEPDEPPTTP